MLSGTLKLGELWNDRYPDVRPSMMAQYFREPAPAPAAA